MPHTKSHAEKHGRSVYARLLKRHGVTKLNNNLYYNAPHNFNMNMSPRRVNMLMKQAQTPRTRYNYLLKQVNVPEKMQKENEASAFRRMLAAVRARLRHTGRKLNN
jgi:hypothetical protein